ncbi:hypothetical protein ACWCW7_32250 [Nocardia tengchongensis]
MILLRLDQICPVSFRSGDQSDSLNPSRFRVSTQQFSPLAPDHQYAMHGPPLDLTTEIIESCAALQPPSPTSGANPVIDKRRAVNPRDTPSLGPTPCLADADTNPTRTTTTLAFGSRRILPQSTGCTGNLDHTKVVALDSPSASIASPRAMALPPLWSSRDTLALWKIS